MRVANYNTNALMSALKSDLDEMRETAEGLIVVALRTHPTQAEAAVALKTTPRSFRSMLRLMRIRSPGKVPARR